MPLSHFQRRCVQTKVFQGYQYNSIPIFQSLNQQAMLDKSSYLLL